MDKLRDITLSSMIDSIPENIKSTFLPFKFEKGDIVIKEGDLVNYGYLVIDGTYDVLKSDFNERSYLIERKKNGGLISFMDIYSGKLVQCATICAASKMKGYKIPVSQCFRLLYTPSLFQPYLIRIWADQFYTTNVEQRNLPLYSYKSKLCRYISQKAVLKNNKYSLVMSRDTLLNIIGCSRRTLFRLLGSLREGGYIETNRNEISLSIHQMEKLREDID